MHDRCLGPSSNWEDATFASSKSEFESPWFHEAGRCQFDSDLNHLETKCVRIRDENDQWFNGRIPGAMGPSSNGRTTGWQSVNEGSIPSGSTRGKRRGFGAS